ncbi:MAG: hypothetical protein V1743_01440 [Nanoarchaeota archaeon]
MVDFDKGYHDIHDKVHDMEEALRQLVEYKATYDRLKQKGKRSAKEQKEYEDAFAEMKKRIYDIRSWCSYIVQTVNQMNLK